MSGEWLRVVVDRDRCQGYANCLEAAPAAFSLDDHDVAVPLAPAFPGSMRSELEASARRCPVAAIAVVDCPPT